MYAHTPNLLERSRLPVFDNPAGFENWRFFSSDLTFTFRCKQCATALHFNFLAQSAIQIPANSQTQNLDLLQSWNKVEESVHVADVFMITLRGIVTDKTIYLVLGCQLAFLLIAPLAAPLPPVDCRLQ